MSVSLGVTGVCFLKTVVELKQKLCTPFASFLEVKTASNSHWEHMERIFICGHCTKVQGCSNTCSFHGHANTHIVSRTSIHVVETLLKLMHAWKVEYLIARECIYKHAYVKICWFRFCKLYPKLDGHGWREGNVAYEHTSHAHPHENLASYRHVADSSQMTRRR